MGGDLTEACGLVLPDGNDGGADPKWEIEGEVTCEDVLVGKSYPHAFAERNGVHVCTGDGKGGGGTYE